MSSRLGTTTWPERHSATFAALGHCLARLDISTPTVLNVGSGAVSAFLSHRIAPGEGDQLSWLANRWRAGLRNLDSVLRQVPSIRLHSYEPGELLDVLPKDAKLIVTDINPRVVDAITAQYPRIDARIFDFSANPFDQLVDVVVCLCVLVRANNAAEIFANLYNSLRPGGLIVMDNRSLTSFSASYETPVEELTDHIWRKPIDQHAQR